MIAITSIVETFRSRRRQLEMDIESQYKGFIEALAHGDEVDVNYGCELLEKLGVNDPQDAQDRLAKDSENRVERDHHQESLRQKIAIRDTLPMLRNDLATAQAALQVAYDRLQPAIVAAAEKLRAAETETANIGWFEDRLRESVMDPSIPRRRKELEAKRHDILTKVKPISDDLNNARTHARSYSNRVETIENEGKRLDRRDLIGRAKNRKAMDEAKAAYDHQMKTVDRLAEMVADLTAELPAMDRELADLDAKAIAS